VIGRKINQSGIGVYGPVISGGGKLENGVISNNKVELEEGMMGIQIRKCDDFILERNRLVGSAYYGVQVSGRITPDQDQGAYNNKLLHNDFSEFRVKPPDNYSDKYGDGRTFVVNANGSNTCHIWLNSDTAYNEIISNKETSIIDEAKENIIRKL
jgi:hypothetical protein